MAVQRAPMHGWEPLWPSRPQLSQGRVCVGDSPDRAGVVGGTVVPCSCSQRLGPFRPRGCEGGDRRAWWRTAWSVCRRAQGLGPGFKTHLVAVRPRSQEWRSCRGWGEVSAKPWCHHVGQPGCRARVCREERWPGRGLQGRTTLTLSALSSRGRGGREEGSCRVGCEGP